MGLRLLGITIKKNAMKTNLISISGRMGSGKNVVAGMIQQLTANNGGAKWKQKAFAGKLKKIASILTGIPIEKFEDREFKDSVLGNEWGNVEDNPLNSIPPFKDIKFNNLMSVREFLQKLGTDGLRDGLHENVWVNALFADFVKSGYAINLRHLQDLDKTPIEIAEEVKSLYGGNWEKYISDNELPESTTNPIDGSKWIITDTRFPNELQAVKDRGGITIQLTRNSDVESDHISETALDNAKFDYILDNKHQTLEETFEDLTEILKNMT